MTLVDLAALAWALCILTLLLLGSATGKWAVPLRVALRLLAAVAGVGFVAKVYGTFAPFFVAAGG